MSPEAFRQLKRGDIIRNRGSNGASWMVDANYGDRITLVRSMEATNPHEWDLAVKGPKS